MCTLDVEMQGAGTHHCLERIWPPTGITELLIQLDLYLLKAIDNPPMAQSRRA